METKYIIIGVTLIFCVIYIIFIIKYYGKKTIHVNAPDVVVKTDKDGFTTSQVIATPERVNFTIVFENEKQINYELFSDLTINYASLISGNYKIPPHLRQGKEKNPFKGHYDMELERKIMLDEIKHKQYKSISKLINK